MTFSDNNVSKKHLLPFKLTRFEPMPGSQTGQNTVFKFYQQVILEHMSPFLSGEGNTHAHVYCWLPALLDKDVQPKTR